MIALIFMVCTPLGWRHHRPTTPNSTKVTSTYTFHTMVVFCYSCGSRCKTRKGLENHLKSRPGCLDELGISRESNWAATLGLSSVTTSSEAINHHTFGVETDVKLAAKRPVDFMWHDENLFEGESSTSDSPFKSLKHSSTPSIRGGGKSSIFIQHRCGSKTIEVTIDAYAASGLLNDSLLNKLSLPSTSANDLSLSQIERLCTLMDPANEDISTADDPNFSDDGQDFWDTPPPSDDNDPLDDDADVNVNVEEDEERMFANAKMYTDRGNGFFSNEEILSIHLLGIMRDIGAPLKTYGRIVALFKDVITEQEAITTTFRHRHTAIKHFSNQFCMKGLYPTILTQPSPVNNRFYPVPVHDAQAMIESLLYSSLAMDDNNLLFPNPDDPLAPPPTEVTNISDIDTGRVYRNAYNKLCDRPNKILCGLIGYIYKLATDRHGHLSLEPVYFTLSIFKQKVRNRPEAWRPLGYIPNIGLMSKAESTHAMKSSVKVQLYHDILTQIFGSLGDLQRKGGLPYQFNYHGKVYQVLLFPLTCCPRRY